MTGWTHDQIAAAGSLGGGLALQLPPDQSAALVLGAVAFARAPDYLEPLVRTPHRTVTHYLPFGFAVAVAWLFGLCLLARTQQEVNLAYAWSFGVMLGCWLHSFADALTDSGCWLWRRERQALLPKRLRIKVYTIERKRNWLTRKVTTTKKPSRGERCYGWAARIACVAFAAGQVVLLAHEQIGPPPA